MIPKVGNAMQVNQFRGIMLLNLLPRRAHACFRPMLMDELEKERPQGQIGGLPHQEAAFGSLAMRLFVRCAYSCQLPTCILFFDLKAAYHSLVRELVLGADLSNEKAKQVLTRQLLQDGFSKEDIDRMVGSSGLLPEGFRREWFRELHSFTWSSIVDEPVATNRGSRPGSPLADSIFHLAMAPLIREMEQWLAQRTERQVALSKLNHPGLPVVWADDLSVQVISTCYRHFDDRS